MRAYNEQLHKGLKVFVYYNLHRNCWSAKALEGAQKGRVVFHADIVALDRVTPKVSQRGRERVIREQKKNVHAGLVGIVTSAAYGRTAKLENYLNQLTYNPYLYSSFVDKETKEIYTGSEFAILSNKTVFYAGL